MQVQRRFFSRSGLACAIFLSALLAISIGTSSFLARKAPGLALAINPHNGEARIGALIAGLAGMQAVPDNERLGEVRKAAERQIALAPADARGYSLLAETYHLAGEEETAAMLFDQALQYSQTEIHALQRSFERLAGQGRFAEALERFDLISRRWETHFARLAPHLAGMLQQKEAYEKALELLRASPPWAGRFFRALMDDQNGLAVAYRLQIDLGRLDGKALPLEAENTMHALIRAGQYRLAHRLFLFTQSDEDRRIAGYVFNGDFSAEPGRRPFDWRVRDNASAEAYWSPEGDTGNGQIRIRFLGKPVKTVDFSQSLHLPPGSYAIRMEYSAAGLETPRGLRLRLTCVDPRVETARIEIPEQRADRQVLTAGFDVAPGGCGLHRIGMDTQLIADSFLHAYQGTLTLHSIQIDRVEP